LAAVTLADDDDDDDVADVELPVTSVESALAPLGIPVSMTGGKVCSGGWPVGGGDAFWAAAPRANTSSI
jgi:hypothetical protein